MLLSQLQKYSSTKQQGGFSLLEIMITVIIANIALLGLVAGEVKSTQYANNSYQYTVSLIQANNVAERLLNDICNFKNGDKTFNADYAQSGDITPIDGYQLSLEFESNVDGSLPSDLNITVSWVDERMDEDEQAGNQVKITAHFPEVESGCTVL